MYLSSCKVVLFYTIGIISINVLTFDTGEASSLALPTHSEVKLASSKLKPVDLKRLNEMFRDSQRLATGSLYELNVLEQLKHNFNVHNKTSINSDGSPISNDENQLIIHRDGKSSEKQYQVSTKPNNQSNGSQIRILGASGVPLIGPTDDIVIKEIKSFKEETDQKAHDKPKLEPKTADNNPRQSNMFSGFTFPAAAANFPNPMLGGMGGLNSNPLLGNLMRSPTFPSFPALPTLPPLPTLPLATPKAPRPPKTSIIGNNGGPMALTNDNVVVVNVLSNNYK